MTISDSRVMQYCSNIVDNLWLSATSVDFYKDVHQKRTGWGVGYFFPIYLLVATVYALYAFGVIYKLENSAMTGMEHIAPQVPTIDYDGSSISTKSSAPIVIRNQENQDIAVIDPEGDQSAIQSTLAQGNKDQLGFGKTSIFYYSTKSHSAERLMSYELLLGHNPLTITNGNIAYYFGRACDRLNNMLDIALIPVALLYFVVQLSMTIVIAGGLSIISRCITPTTFQTSYRIAIIGSCPSFLLNALLYSFLPSDMNFGFVAQCLNVIIFLKIITALVRIRRESAAESANA